MLEDMLDDAPGPINFTMFLTLFGEKLNGARSGSTAMRNTPRQARTPRM